MRWASRSPTRATTFRFGVQMRLLSTMRCLFDLCFALAIYLRMQGTDVARKMVILAREMGLRVEISSVVIETLVPDELFALSVSEFLAKLSELDAGKEFALPVELLGCD